MYFEGRERKIMQQLGSIIYEFSKLQFDLIGSLVEDGGSFVVREILSPSFIFGRRHELDISRGPFARESEYYEALLVVSLSMATTYHWAATCSLDQFQYPKNMHLWMSIILQRIDGITLSQ